MRIHACPLPDAPPVALSTATYHPTPPRAYSATEGHRLACVREETYHRMQGAYAVCAALDNPLDAQAHAVHRKAIREWTQACNAEAAYLSACIGFQQRQAP